MPFQDRFQNLALIMALVLLSTLLLEPTIRLAYRIGLVDRPDAGRKLHAKTTAYMGGAILWLGVAAGLLAGAVVGGWGVFGPVLAAVTILFMTGIVDDAVDLPPRTKLAFQILAVSILVLERMSQLPDFGWHLPGVLGAAALVLVGVGVVNAFNLIDGLDGLSLGLGIIVATPPFLACLAAGNMVGLVLGLAFVATATGLLRGNLHPARIFLGDAGSLLVGGVVFELVLLQVAPPRGMLDMAAAACLPLAVCIPVVDMVVVVLRRWKDGKPLFQGDRSHLHHRLQRLGLTHVETVGWIHAAMAVAAVFQVVVAWLGLASVWNLALVVFWAGLYAVLRVLEGSQRLSVPKGVVHVP